MSDLLSLRARIENNEVKGGSAFGRAAATVIALTAEEAARSGADAVRAAVKEAAEWGVRTKPSMTSMRAVAQIAVDALNKGSGQTGETLAATLAADMRSFIVRSEQAVRNLAEAGVTVFRPGADALVHSFSESLVNVLRGASEKFGQLETRFTESRPLRESRLLMQALAGAEAKMKLYSDAGMAIAASGADMAIVGADAILADGSFANKTGALPLALVSGNSAFRCLSRRSCRRCISARQPKSPWRSVPPRNWSGRGSWRAAAGSRSSTSSSR